jgi:hypothetical protein
MFLQTYDICSYHIDGKTNSHTILLFFWLQLLAGDLIIFCATHFLVSGFCFCEDATFNMEDKC